MPPDSSTNIPLLTHFGSIWYYLKPSKVPYNSELQNAKKQNQSGAGKQLKQIWRSGKEFTKALRLNHIANKKKQKLVENFFYTHGILKYISGSMYFVLRMCSKMGALTVQ